MKTLHKIFRRGLIGFAMFCCLNAAQAKTVDRDLLIVLSDKRALKEYPNYAKNWTSACTVLAEGFKDLARAGTTGTFSRVICERKVISTKMEDFIKSSRENWILHINNDEETIEINMYHRSHKGYVQEASYNLSRRKAVLDGTVLDAVQKPKDKEESLFQALSDPNVVRYLSLLIQDQLPILSVVRFKKNGRHTFNLDPQVIKPDTLELAVFDLKYDAKQGVFVPQVVGYIKDAGPRWSYELKPGAYSFNKPYFVQAVTGRLSHQTRLNSLLDNAIGRYGFGSFLSNLFSSLDSSFGGLRLGIPLLKGDDLISNSMLVSAFVESRSGLLKGVRFYYDIAPEVSSGNEKFSWKKASLGYSFDLPVPNGVSKYVSRLDAAVKLGLLDVDVAFEVSDTAGNVQKLTLQDQNSPSIGLEFGAEKTVVGILGRAWFSFDDSSLISGDVGLTSLKVGLDGYYDVYSFLGKDVKLQAMGFTFFEQPTWTNKREVSSDESFIEELSFVLFFVGGGMTVSW